MRQMRWQYPVYVSTRQKGRCRVWTRFPRHGKRLVLRCGSVDVVAEYHPRSGVVVLSTSTVPGVVPVVEHQYPDVRMKAVKRKAVSGAANAPVVEPCRDTKVWAKLPRLVEHLVVRQYEDGTAREPGKVFIGCEGSAFTVTLKEPSSHGQVTFRAATLDDALVVADRWLGADDAPWELDQWSYDRAQEKKLKKKK